MRKFGLFHPLVLSFYSQPLYADVARNWRGITFLYLLLVLALCWVPGMVKMQTGLSKFIKKDAPALVQQIPRVSIINGEVSTDVETPYYINDPDSGKTLMILDLTGEFTSLEGTGAKMLLTRNQLIAEKSAIETRTYDLSGIKNFSIDRATIEGWLQLARSWLVPLLFPIILLFSYCYRLFQALVYGLIGLIIAQVLHVPLGLMASVRLAIIAITPVLILDTLLGLTEFRLPAWWLLGFAIAMGYLFFGIKAASSAPPPGETPGPQPGQG